MKTAIKSFIGAVAGTVLVLFLAFFLLKPKQYNKFNSGEAEVQQPQSTVKTPVISTAYHAPQNFNFLQAAKKSVNAVVHIKTIIGVKPQQYDDFFGSLRNYLNGYPRQSSILIAFGSGVVISPNGYIVTNNHVIAGAEKITVTFNDKRELVAKVIGTSPATDLALIKVKAKDLPYLTYGNSNNLKVGQWVLAVGNPFNLTSTVTAGIVSAKARDIHILGEQSSIDSFIQTDAAVNPGNSGGALVNTEGQLVGINTAIASQTGTFEGYSFAIPVNLVKKVIGDLMKYGQIQRAYLGVEIRDIDAPFAKKNHLHDLDGVYVAGVVQKGGAANAGIQSGDIITSFNNQTVKSVAGFMGTIDQCSPGNIVKVTVLRGNKTKIFRVTLKNKNGTLGIIKPLHSFYNEELGAQFRTATSNDMGRLGIKHGIVVTHVGQGIIRKGGISKGFIITEVNNRMVNSQKELESALNLSKYQGHVIRVKGMYPSGLKISFEFML